MEDLLKFGECYICLEETPLLSQCECVERYLCENCMEKLRIYNYNFCTVCRAKYPKMYEESIDIDIDVEVQRVTFTFKPCCLRRRSERHHPKYCFTDCTFHIVAVCFITITSSCSTNPNHKCYRWNAVNYLFPSLAGYFVLCGFLASICK